MLEVQGFVIFSRKIQLLNQFPVLSFGGCVGWQTPLSSRISNPLDLRDASVRVSGSWGLTGECRRDGCDYAQESNGLSLQGAAFGVVKDTGVLAKIVELKRGRRGRRETGSRAAGEVIISGGSKPMQPFCVPLQPPSPVRLDQYWRSLDLGALGMV